MATKTEIMALAKQDPAAFHLMETLAEIEHAMEYYHSAGIDYTHKEDRQTMNKILREAEQRIHQLRLNYIVR